MKQGKYGKYKELGIITEWEEDGEIRMAGKYKKIKDTSLSAQDIIDEIL